MSKKVYAKTLSPDVCTFCEMYLDELSPNGELVIESHGHSCDYDPEKVLKTAEKLVDFCTLDDEEECKQDVLVRLNVEFPRRGRTYSEEEVDKVTKALRDPMGAGYTEYLRNVTRTLLEVLKGEPYQQIVIRGASQGDVATVYAPASWPQERVDTVEAIYFGTGTEIVVDDSGEEITDPNDISGYHIYTSKYNEDDLKAEVADQAGCNAEDVVLWVFDGYERKAIYKEV